MSKELVGLRERNRIRNREDILIAISELLGAKEYNSITIDDITHRAGVSRGTVYTYFPAGRDEIVREAYVRIATRLTEDGSQRRDKESTPVERICALAAAFTEVARSADGRFYALMSPDLVGVVRTVAGTTSSAFHAMLSEDLDFANKQGRMPEGANIGELGVSISGAIREIGKVAAKEPQRAEDLVEGLRVICAALVGERPGSLG